MDTEENISVGNISTLERRLDERSPMSAGRLNASTMSMRAKAKRKRHANAQHNSNFKAGYIPVDEDVLLRSGIRGRKRYFLYCTLILLLIIVLLNALVTAWLIYILGLTHNGLLSIELTDINGREFLRVLADAKIITMSFSEQAILGARYNSSLSFTSSQSMLKVEEAFGSAVSLEDGILTFSADDIMVYSPTSGKQTPISVEAVLEAADNLYIGNTTASKIESHSDIGDLSLESANSEVGMEANGSVQFTSQKEIHVGMNRVVLDAQNAISLDGGTGIFVDPNLLRISTARTLDPSMTTYKLCVCESGKIFRVPVQDRYTTCDLGQHLLDVCS